jgi:hypothetical protein
MTNCKARQVFIGINPERLFHSEVIILLDKADISFDELDIAVGMLYF